jgi:YesN/AraC family two-component response regulator
MRRLMCTVLQQNGFQSLQAEDGVAALEVMDKEHVDLVVLDLMMPRMDGFALLKTVKTTLEYSHIPVILLTAKNTIQSKIEGLEYGADAYIEKPFSLDVLLAQISNLFISRENIRNAYSQSPIVHLKNIAYTKADEHFLEKLDKAIHKHIADVNLDVGMIADMMNMSRPTLYRKINAMSNLTPNDFIRIARLKKAAALISEKQLKIYEISEAVGFSSQSYFSRSFIKQFGMNPSEYAKRLNENGA